MNLNVFVFRSIGLGYKILENGLKKYPYSLCRASMPLSRQIGTSASVKIRFFFNSKKPDDEDEDKLKLPKIIYPRNPLNFFRVRFKLYILKLTWDPEFSISGFFSNCDESFLNIMLAINQHKMEELDKYFYKKAKIDLMEKLQDPTIYQAIPKMDMTKENLQVSDAYKVHYLKKSKDGRKFCGIDFNVAFLKPTPGSKTREVLFVNFMARFVKEYTENVVGEWKISNLIFLKCDLFDEDKLKKKS